ncbi:MAG: diguanylate cyclase [Treponema sp.]|nr:diguanylate cyclase [Treponema sp.]
MKITRRLKNTFILALVPLLVITTIFSIIFFHRKVSQILRSTVLTSLTEVQELYKITLKEQFDDQFSMLEAQARYFEDTNLDDEEELKRIISSTKGIGAFKKVAVANERGVCTNYTGESLSNITTKSYFKNTFLTMQPQVSDKIELDDNLQPSLTLTYPLKMNNKIKAMIIGTLPYKALQNQFSLSLFSGQNYFYIISHDGNIILSNREKNKSLYNIDIYEYLMKNSKDSDAEIMEMHKDIIRGNSGFIDFKGLDTDKIFAYSPLGMNEWYIISVIPSSYINDQKVAFSNMVLKLLLEIALSIGILIFLMGSLLRRNSSVEKDNERLTIATHQNQALIFEYDIQKKLIEFSGDTGFILGTDKKTLSPELAKTEYFKRVHEDDNSVLELLQDSISGKNSDFLGEFRYLNFNNEYIWVRMTGSLIYKEDLSPAKFIGSINNVNAQMVHEQELKSIAEIDSLTTLLNKSAMQKHTSEYLTEKKEDALCALFMLDLDNFKMVNDTLGHMAGDMAIKDAAKKLSLIFSEKDYISRFGGDEFCILLRVNENIGEETFMRLVNEKAQNLCLFLQEKYFDEKNSVDVSASVGIALCPKNGKTYDELFTCADEALYRVKQKGKNGYQIGDEGCK